MMRLVLVSLGFFTSVMFGQPTIATTALPNPIVGRAVSGAVWTMTATGGASPYTWAVSAGSLPAGLSLSANGAIIGTATGAGVATFTIQVTDSASTIASQSYTITAQYAIGIGCTTATLIDHDCDYYGAGSAIGPDADDNDPTVNTSASMLAKYGTLNNFLSTVRGYNPLHTWYLSSATGNDSTCVANNVSLPCKTWGAIHGKIAAGDAIVVRAGVIDENSNYTLPHSGTLNNPTIVMGYPGELARFDHSSSYGWFGFQGQPQNMILDGLLLTSSGSTAGYGFSLSGAAQLSHVTIRNFEVRNYYDGIWAIAGSDNVLIENNLIHDDAGEHNIYVGQNSSDSGHMVGLTVRGNILYNCGRDNFHDNGICDSCILTGNILYSANMTANGGAANISMQNGWNHGTISNNIVFNASAYVLLLNAYNDANPTITAQDANYNQIVNNTLIHTGYDSSGQNLSGQGFTTVAIISGAARTPPIDLGHNTYANNVFIEAGTKNSGVVRYEPNAATDLNWLSTDTWTNNVMYASNGASPVIFGLGLGTAQNWAYFQSNAAAFTNNSQVNPNLVAWKPAWWGTPSLFDLAPQAGSPVIGTGLSASAPSSDITGLTRNTPPDIGAYQFAGSAPTVSRCDLNGDGVVNVLDVVLAVNQVIGTSPCTNANLQGTGTCTPADVQIIIAAAVGGACAAQ